MKRIYLVLIVLCILLLAASACGEAVNITPPDVQPIYDAVIKVDFHIRVEPKERCRWVTEVAEGETITVLEYGEQWCKVEYDNAQGYCKTKWLHRFRSLSPDLAPVPGYLSQEGFAQVVAPLHASVRGYEGNDFQPGGLISVHLWDAKSAQVHMMRSVIELAAGALKYTPYVPWMKAVSGDPIGGFTTYYNEKTGGRLAENRQWNIELACRRVNGTMVRAGKSFSYNKLCAPYKKENGYKMAPNISRDGKGYGGGVCQLTTTVYNAVLGLPLQILEWSVHRDSGVDYIPKNFDAAVGSYSDLVFENTLPYDIRMEALPQNGMLTVLIYRV